MVDKKLRRLTSDRGAGAVPRVRRTPKGARNPRLSQTRERTRVNLRARRRHYQPTIRASRAN